MDFKDQAATDEGKKAEVTEMNPRVFSSLREDGDNYMMLSLLTPVSVTIPFLSGMSVCLFVCLSLCMCVCLFVLLCCPGFLLTIGNRNICLHLLTTYRLLNLWEMIFF